MNLYPCFSEAEFSRRYTAVRAAMREAELSALALYGTVGSYNEVQYLSNFPVTREAMLVFPLDGEPTLLVQMFNHVPNARQVACSLYPGCALGRPGYGDHRCRKPASARVDREKDRPRGHAALPALCCHAAYTSPGHVGRFHAADVESPVYQERRGDRVPAQRGRVQRPGHRGA